MSARESLGVCGVRRPPSLTLNTDNTVATLVGLTRARFEEEEEETPALLLLLQTERARRDAGASVTIDAPAVHAFATGACPESRVCLLSVCMRLCACLYVSVFSYVCMDIRMCMGVCDVRVVCASMCANCSARL